MTISSEYRKFQMSLLYKNASKINANSNRMLFWVPGGMPSMLEVEGAIAAALKLRGCKVHAVICDGALSGCVLRDIKSDPEVSQWHNRCKACRKNTSFVLEGLGIPYSGIGQYIDTKRQKDYLDIASHRTWNSIQSFTYKGIQLGKNISSAITRYYKGREMDNIQQVLKAYTYSAIVTTEASISAIQLFKPDRIFMSHATYVDWGPALQIALKKKIPVTGWMASYLPSRFYLKHIRNKKNFDFHDLEMKDWNTAKKQNFFAKEEKRLSSYIDSRYQKNISFDMKKFHKMENRSKNLLKKLNLFSYNKPVWGILTHINWDAVGDYSPMIYDNFDSWVLDTLKEIIQIKDINWLIKIHPAESWENPESGAEILIKKHFHNLPKNIKIISADHPINPNNFIQMIDGAVTVYGTLGLEMCLQGKPVILAGEAHYGRKGFTYDCNSKDEYKKLLSSLGKIKPLSSDQICLAKKYAYCYFIQRQIPIPVVMDPKSIWWKFNYKKRNLLILGKDPFMDFICDRIIDGKDFIMNERLVKLSESY